MSTDANGDSPSGHDYLASLSPIPQPPGDLIQQGAEARIFSVASHLSTGPATLTRLVVKERFVKQYRHPALDASLSLRRMRAEARQLVKCRQLGLPVPALLLVSIPLRQLWMEDVCQPHGMSLGAWFHAILEQAGDSEKQKQLDAMAQKLGALLAKMHANNVIHGDLTTANILVQMDDPVNKFTNYRLYLIDFGLSSVNNRAASNVHDEEVAVDLYVLERALVSSLATRATADSSTFSFTPEAFFEALLTAYSGAYPEEVMRRPTETARTTPAQKRARHNSTSWLPVEEDGIQEVRGILNTLKEVQARGRKRLMIG